MNLLMGFRFNGKTYASTCAEIGKKLAEHATAMVVLRSLNLYAYWLLY